MVRRVSVDADSDETTDSMERPKSMLDTDFEILFAEFKPKVWMYVLQKVPAQDAEDVFQEICVNVFTKLENLKDPDKFLPWVFSITRRRVQDYYRAKYNQPPMMGEDQFELPLLEDASFSHDRRLYIKDLRKCVISLREPYRDVAMLHFILGLSAPEIVKVLDLNENTVKSHIIRSRPLIMKCIQRKKK